MECVSYARTNSGKLDKYESISFIMRNFNKTLIFLGIEWDEPTEMQSSVLQTYELYLHFCTLCDL